MAAAPAPVPVPAPEEEEEEEEVALLYVTKRRLPLWMSSSSTPTTSSSTVASFPKSHENTTTTTTLGKRKSSSSSSSRDKLSKKVTLSDDQDSHHPIPIEEEDKQVVVEEDKKGFRPKSKPKPNTKKKRITRINKPAAPLSPNNTNKTHPPQVKVNQDEQQQQQQQQGHDTQEEEQLTVDDLMIIAQEYVNADDGGKDYQLGVESGKQTATSRYESSEVLSTHTSVGLLSNSDQSNSSSQEAAASEEIITNSSQMVDPTQDMLDLFLGPLLKKPWTDEEKKRETYIEEIVLDNRFRKASDGEELGTQVPTMTLMKKKTSLRDKVAMLLD